ncbi:hypothetical protein G5B40_03530 [Pikeienuella piscinae]|uniref:Uncharacterized protein n=1 Tax=Pikeienuella piscinae TaxID=2748098 RepID=A0A7L5BYA9_9RHOB|nr:hypothetical protein [Pikeienuella piscinae]QIE54589.1 hypothetical protein G5B40_03530 [Pikeienuella piscinae]
MKRIGAALASILTAVALSGCSGSIFGDDAEEAAAQAAQLPHKIPVERIETMELGRLYDGYMLTAYAIAPGVGYYQPELRPRYEGGLSADGFYEFDFLVRPPEDLTIDPGAPLSARMVRGDFELPVDKLRGAAGVRVWSAQDSVEGRF